MSVEIFLDLFFELRGVLYSLLFHVDQESKVGFVFLLLESQLCSSAHDIALDLWSYVFRKTKHMITMTNDCADATDKLVTRFAV